MDQNEVAIKASLNKIIDWFSQHLSDPLRVSSDLWKFAKIHSRRSYTLIRFCMNPETDYKTVIKAIVSVTVDQL
jgi:sister-chromatid-cohesion protein PDS5